MHESNLGDGYKRDNPIRSNIELEEALAILCEGMVPPVETVSLYDASGRVLAEPVYAPLDQPPFDRSPLDGYALCAADTSGADKQHPVCLRVIETVYAGDMPSKTVASGEAVRLTTGAPLPSGCDCVIRHEDTDNGRETVQVYRSLRPHDNYCDQGEDYRKGALLVPAGTRLDAYAIGVLASVGVMRVPIYRKPTVGVISTGDEIVPPETDPLPPGKTYDSNQLMLSVRLEELGLGHPKAKHMPDVPEAVAEEIRRLFDSCDCDVILTTGGVSVGDKDIFHQVIPLLGVEPLFWRVKLKPGSPALYARYTGMSPGTHPGKPLLCLSGNPFAAAATFELLARPLLAALSGDTALNLVPAQARLSGSFPKSSPARRFLRGHYEDGVVIIPKKHASGMLSTAIGCNCLVDIPAGSPPLSDGQKVRVWLL